MEIGISYGMGLFIWLIHFKWIQQVSKYWFKMESRNGVLLLLLLLLSLIVEKVYHLMWFQAHIQNAGRIDNHHFLVIQYHRWYWGRNCGSHSQVLIGYEGQGLSSHLVHFLRGLLGTMDQLSCILRILSNVCYGSTFFSSVFFFLNVNFFFLSSICVWHSVCCFLLVNHFANW